MSTLRLYKVSGALAALTIAGLRAFAAPRPEGPGGAGRETPGYAIKHCNHHEMERRGASCQNPKGCYNACAAKCENRTECMQCCQGFKDDDYDKCKWGCNEVWPPAPPPPPTPE